MLQTRSESVGFVTNGKFWIQLLLLCREYPQEHFPKAADADEPDCTRTCQSRKEKIVR